MRSLASFVVLALGAGVVLAQQATPPSPPPPPPPPIPIVQLQPGQVLPEQKGTGLVMGQVVDARGAGVPSAIVQLQGGIQPIALTTTNRDIPGGPKSTITTSDGRFVFLDLTPGTYTFNATKPGYIAGAYGRVRPNGQAQSITLGDGEYMTSIRIQMWDYASLTGTVRDETGEPVVGLPVRALRRAIVHGRFQFVAAANATTNDRGEYRFDALPPGRYGVVVVATHTAMPAAEFGARTAGTLPVEIQIELMRAGLPVTSGAAGREVSGWIWSSPRSTLAVPNPSEDGRLLVYPTTFYPAARSSRDAELITLEPGQERVAVDLRMQLVPASTVSGVVTSADGQSSGIALRLAPEWAEDLAGDLTGLDAAATITDGAGRFMFVGVPAGQYFVQAQLRSITAPPGSAPAPQRRGWLNEPLTVGESGATGVTLAIRPTVRVSGRLAFEGTKPPPPPEIIERLVVSMETIGFAVNRVEAPYQATFDRNGQFVIPAVPPGTYVITFRASIQDRRAMPDWETKGASLEGRDIADRPITITEDVSGVVVTLTNTNTELNGMVRDASGKIDPTAAVLMFTTERELWPVRMVRRVRALRASETGAYSVRGVPPGEYFLVAIPDVDIGDYPDPGMLEALTKIATRFVMTPAERKTIDLTVRSIK